MRSTKILDVPYLVQPTDITCQSTCLKMYARYLADTFQISNEGCEKNIEDIWKEINVSAERPNKSRNSYENMIWWLKRYYPHLNFQLKSSNQPTEAADYIVKRINEGFPVMISTNHSRTDGHIILVIGYKEFGALYTDANTKFICHDPYGKFNPSLKSKEHSSKRYSGGYSTTTGEVGPGKAVEYDYDGIRRIRTDRHSAGVYYLISA